MARTPELFELERQRGKWHPMREAAERWLDKWDVRFNADFTGHRLHFPDDTDTRDTYRITLFRYYSTGIGTKDISFSVNFGQSINNSKFDAELSRGPLWNLDGRMFRHENSKRIPPNIYDLLTCITKHDPGTFEDFCSDSGYSTDSRLALEIFLACQKEYSDFVRFCGFDTAMLDEAREIN